MGIYNSQLPKFGINGKIFQTRPVAAAAPYLQLPYIYTLGVAGAKIWLVTKFDYGALNFYALNR